MERKQERVILYNRAMHLSVSECCDGGSVPYTAGWNSLGKEKLLLSKTFSQQQ